MNATMKEDIANYLLNNCFILGSFDATRDKYYQVLNNKEEFTELFRPLGYTLILHPSPLKVIQLVNNHEGNQTRLLKYESILLLILRLLYIQKRESLSTGDDMVISTVEELQAEYGKLNLTRKLDQRILESAFRTFKHYNLAIALDRLSDITSRVQIFPSVLLALPDNLINWSCDQTQAYLAQYQRITEKEGEEEDDAE